LHTIKVESEGQLFHPSFLGPAQNGEAGSVSPAWMVLHEEAGKLGFQSSWLLPIISTQRRLLGVFVLHFRDVLGPDKALLDLIDVYNNLAVIAIENAQCCRNWQIEQMLPHMERSADAI